MIAITISLLYCIINRIEKSQKVMGNEMNKFMFRDWFELTQTDDYYSYCTDSG